MKIFITGSSNRVLELQKVIAREHEIITEQANTNLPNLAEFDLIFDLNLDDNPNHLGRYAPLKDKLVIGCAVKKTLHAIYSTYGGTVDCLLVGMNCLPTFISRSVLELSFMNKESEIKAAEQLKLLGLNYVAVADQTGMVTPRIIFMIINEAFNTLYNGVATEVDIDKGMKLGTAYPLGPFEWAGKIGIKDIYETLIALRDATNDARYTISPLLQQRYTLNDTHIGAGI